MTRNGIADVTSVPLSADRRPTLATAVGVIGVVAGAVPLIELTAVLVSERFAAWFLPLVQSIVAFDAAMIPALLLAIGLVDIALGVGVLNRKRLALYGMIVRSVVVLPIDYVNFRAGNQVGAFIGFAISLFLVWALLQSDVRRWFAAS